METFNNGFVATNSLAVGNLSAVALAHNLT